LPKDKFTTGEKLPVTFKTATSNLDGNDAITSEYPVGYTIIAIRNQDELFAAFNSQELKNSTSGKLFILENDIALTDPWTPVQELRNAVIDGQGHKITNLQIKCAELGKLCGMFKYLYGNVTVKNLGLQGKVFKSEGLGSSSATGLLAGMVGDGDVKNIRVNISNSNFDSEISNTGILGGVIGIFYAGGVFESITIDSRINGETKKGKDPSSRGYDTSSRGSFFGRIRFNQLGIKFKNIRIKSTLTNEGKAFVGGLAGSLVSITDLKAENMILDIKVINPSQNSVDSSVGGLFGKLFELNRPMISRVDINLNTKGYNAGVYGLLGGSWKEGDIRSWVWLSDIISRGRILTSGDPRIASNLIAGIAIPQIGIFELNNLVDMSIISYNGQNYVSPLLGKNPINTSTPSASYLYYVLPEGATYIEKLNSLWPVEQLTGDTATAQRDFLVSQGFDFTNTWTIKDIDGIKTIGIKEDSIPQFPTW
jgi:hypothetical protein